MPCNAEPSNVEQFRAKLQKGFYKGFVRLLWLKLEDFVGTKIRIAKYFPSYCGNTKTKLLRVLFIPFSLKTPWHNTAVVSLRIIIGKKN